MSRSAVPGPSISSTKDRRAVISRDSTYYSSRYSRLLVMTFTDTFGTTGTIHIPPPTCVPLLEVQQNHPLRVSYCRSLIDSSVVPFIIHLYISIRCITIVISCYCAPRQVPGPTGTRAGRPSFTPILLVRYLIISRDTVGVTAYPHLRATGVFFFLSFLPPRYW